MNEYQQRLWDAVVAIWTHTEKHAEYFDGRGYITTPHIKPCQDPDEHSRLAAAEGKAWYEYSAYLRSVEGIYDERQQRITEVEIPARSTVRTFAQHEEGK